MGKKIILILLLLGILQIQCFGRFAIIRKIYQFIDDIKISDASPLLTRFVKTLLVWVLFIIPIVGGLAFFVDFCIINLIEFWTGENVIDGYKEKKAYLDKNLDEDKKNYPKSLIAPGKSIAFVSSKTGMKTILSRSEDGMQMVIQTFYNGQKRELVAFKDQPGVLYARENNQEISIHELNNQFKEQETIQINGQNIGVFSF